MSLSSEKRIRMLSETKEAAAAFVEDLAHIREILGRQEFIRGELRRMSCTLRRLLIDNEGGDLRRIAPPRIGRIMLHAPDNGPFYRAERAVPYMFFGSGGAHAFGVWLRGATVERGSVPRKIEPFNPEATVELTQDGFLSQKVICLHGKWATRRDVICFVAHVASGVHSGAARTEIEQTIAVMRNAMSYSIEEFQDGEYSASVVFNQGSIEKFDAVFDYSRGGIDPVLLELLCSAYYLAASPKVSELDCWIKSELRLK